MSEVSRAKSKDVLVACAWIAGISAIGWGLIALGAITPASVRTERERVECEARHCHDAWKKPVLDYRQPGSGCVCVEFPQ